jgi:4-oxalocrotonate tautomerase
MPVLTLKVAPLQSPARYRALAAALTDITERELGKDAQLTAISIEDLPAARWFVARTEVQRPTALLEIAITAGTNDAAQKAAFVAAAFAELQRQLAPGAELEAASYVIVRELPAADWGYGGRTQRSRRTAAHAA